MVLPGDGLSSYDAWHHDICVAWPADASNRMLMLRVVPARGAVGVYSPVAGEYESICVSGSRDSEAKLWQ